MTFPRPHGVVQAERARAEVLTMPTLAECKTMCVLVSDNGGPAQFRPLASLTVPSLRIVRDYYRAKASLATARGRYRASHWRRWQAAHMLLTLAGEE